MKHATAEQKIYLLNQFLEAIRTTVYRQVQFAEFERYIHGEITAGRSLQAEKLEEYWLQSNRDYYGPALTVEKELASEWSRIPHFYTPFYVYKYATVQCSDSLRQCNFKRQSGSGGKISGLPACGWQRLFAEHPEERRRGFEYAAACDCNLAEVCC